MAPQPVRQPAPQPGSPLGSPLGSPPARSRPAGDVDYEAIGTGYVAGRRPDPRIAALVRAALGDARTVINVGAGAGSYEPADLLVTAVEPSAAMRAQRPSGSAPVVDAVAESLPFADDSFDAATAVITVHQWTDWRAGVRELRRVARGRVVIMTFDPTRISGLWLADYFPEFATVEAQRYPRLTDLADVLGGEVSVRTVPIPIDCVDGFTEAFYARPEAFLDEDVRRAQSAWTFVEAAALASGLARLRADLDSGAWDGRYGRLRTQPEFVGALRLVVAR